VSADSFALYETIATTDADLVHSLAHIQARKSSNLLSEPPTLAPVPISSRKAPTVAKLVGKHDMKWVNPIGEKGRKVCWDTDMTTTFNDLANQSPIYPTSITRTLCPDSGATSNMSPYKDMFVDYVDIRHEACYVCLGDEKQRILIHGKGTFCMEVAGRRIAYAETLHVLQLFAILLSTRVHRRSAVSCSFLADNSSCFLTYPSFQIEVDDTDDCTLPCTPLRPSSAPLDFDSRLHLTQNFSAAAVRKCYDLAFRALQQSRLAGIQKPTSHLKGADPTPCNGRDPFPTIPVYAVPNSGVGATERINSSELKKYFGCRGLNDWSYLEETGTGLQVVKDTQGPLTLGEVTTISRNKHGKILDTPPQSLHTVGMDIGYGEGTSPGGYKYVLTLVDFATRYTWTYGLKTKTTEAVINALWCFLVDAGGTTTRIHCDFDSSFVKGKVNTFLKIHRIQVTSAPPKQQSQNGLVERQWRTAVDMARAMLVEASLPRRYWFWTLQESVIRMNLLPCKPTRKRGLSSPISLPPHSFCSFPGSCTTSWFPFPQSSPFWSPRSRATC
jgi:hypothetical protein